MDKKQLTYQQASGRLEEIINKIEHQNPDVDELTSLVAEAVELTKFCRTKLTKADKQISSLMAQLNEDINTED